LKSLSDHFDKLFPLLSLLIEEPNLKEKEFNYCKKESLNNLKKSNENPFNIAFNNFKKILYREHPYSFNSLGDEKSINQIEHNDILNEFKSFTKRNKYLLTNSSKYSFLNIQDTKANVFDNLNKIQSNFNIKNKKNYIEYYLNTKQIIIIIGSQTCPYNHNDSLALRILESYLSYGMSSILFKVFRENNGLTYEAGVFYPSRKFNAPFSIYLSVSERNASLTLNLLLTIWDDLLSKKISENDLSIAKLKLYSSFLHKYRTCEEKIFHKVRLLGFGMDPFYDENIENEIDSITSDKILSISKKYLTNPCLSVSGSEQLCKTLKKIWKKKY
tara:strand:- start:539 stop:1525 length:987 start_codon:yes stop_codon:yes gene_type:complete